MTQTNERQLNRDLGVMRVPLRELVVENWRSAADPQPHSFVQLRAIHGERDLLLRLALRSLKDSTGSVGGSDERSSTYPYGQC
jgi:hypothetical protein